MPSVRVVDDMQHPSSSSSGSVSSPPADRRFLLEHAKGALMMRYGIDSYQALAVLVHWSRALHTPLPVIAHTLVHGICEGNPQTAARQRALVRWLEQELRQHDVDLVRSTSPPVARRH
jgi:hypothetical protein